jgi:hypothetical protein
MWRTGIMTFLKIVFAALLCLPMLLLVIHFLLKLVEEVLTSVENSSNVRYRTHEPRRRRP